MRVVNVINSIDEKTGGGATERAIQLSLHLASIGNDVLILTTDYNLTKSRVESLFPVKVFALPCLLPRFFIPVPTFIKIFQHIRDYDILHLVNHWSLLNAYVYIVARILKKPYVVSPLGALPIFGRSDGFKKVYNFIIGKSLIRNASAHVAATLNELPAYSEYGVGRDAVTHIPNGINAEEYDVDEKEVSPIISKYGPIRYILFMGRLNTIKGPDLLLEAFAQVCRTFDEYHLILIGNDEGMEAGLRAFVDSKGLTDRIHFLGFVTRKEKAHLINGCVLLVVPSRQEAMSIVVLEAGVAGKPVIITDQCGFDEIEEVGGGLVVPATVEGLANGLSKLLAVPDMFDGYGLRLKDFVQRNYLWPAIVLRYSKLFHKIVDH